MKATYNAKTKVLTLEIVCDGPRESSTGKTNLLASSGGFKDLIGKDVPAGAKVSFNVTVPKE